MNTPRSRYNGGVFWDRVAFIGAEGDGCWEWLGPMYRNGYGAAPHEKRPKLAHRVAWILAHGPIDDGLMVLHRCDNRRCVRPEHLFLGTAKENTHDMIRKGRGLVSGVNPPRRKLEPGHVASIRSRAMDGEKQCVLAKEYDVTPSCISDIVRRVSWRTANA